MTSTWTTNELRRFGDCAEIDITTARPGGALRAWVPIWAVRVGDDVYVRSFRGAAGTWFRHATRTGSVRIRLSGEEFAVTVTPAPHTDTRIRPAVDDAYRAKYGRHGSAHVGRMIADPAAATTLRLARS